MIIRNEVTPGETRAVELLRSWQLSFEGRLPENPEKCADREKRISLEFSYLRVNGSVEFPGAMHAAWMTLSRSEACSYAGLLEDQEVGGAVFGTSSGAGFFSPCIHQTSWKGDGLFYRMLVKWVSFEWELSVLASARTDGSHS